MYKEKFIAVIKNKGKILRDENGTVRLPFGSTYSILLRNRNSVKAVANVEVDGEDVLQKYGIIVPPNQSVEIAGWMRSMDKTNKFKFIRKTKEIQDFRGDRLDDGLVRIEYTFEKLSIPEPIMIKNPWEVRYKGNDWNWNYYDTSTGFTVPLTGISSNTITSYNCSAPLKDEGITAKGKMIDQEYQYGSTDLLENVSHVIILKLRGISMAGQKVKKVITTRSRTQCDICGRKWKSNVKYCGNCGNCLH
jgi:hypothetical protein